MEELTIALGVAAALIHGVGYILYNIQTKSGKSVPNVASWSILAFLATLNAFSFNKMSGDLIVTLQFITGSVACTITFFYALGTGKFSWPERKEWICALIGLTAGLVWWKYQNATMASMIILVAFLFSFIPTFRGVLRDPFKEAPIPWIIWTLAFSVTAVNIVLRVKLGKAEPIAFVMPTVLFFVHGGIAVLSTKRRKKRFRKIRT